MMRVLNSLKVRWWLSRHKSSLMEGSSRYSRLLGVVVRDFPLAQSSLRLESCRQNPCTLLGLRLRLRDALRGEDPYGVVAGRLPGAHPCSVHGAHPVERRGPPMDPPPLDVVSVHGVDPGGGVHDDIVDGVRFRHFKLFLGLNTLCPLASWILCARSCSDWWPASRATYTSSLWVHSPP